MLFTSDIRKTRQQLLQLPCLELRSSRRLRGRAADYYFIEALRRPVTSRKPILEVVECLGKENGYMHDPLPSGQGTCAVSPFCWPWSMCMSRFAMARSQSPVCACVKQVQGNVLRTRHRRRVARGRFRISSQCPLPGAKSSSKGKVVFYRQGRARSKLPSPVSFST